MVAHLGLKLGGKLGDVRCCPTAFNASPLCPLGKGTVRPDIEDTFLLPVEQPLHLDCPGVSVLSSGSWAFGQRHCNQKHNNNNTIWRKK